LTKKRETGIRWVLTYTDNCKLPHQTASKVVANQDDDSTYTTLR